MNVDKLALKRFAVLSDKAYDILLHLAAFANKDGFVQANAAEIARAIRARVGTVQYTLSLLVEIKLLQETGTVSCGNIAYRVLLPIQKDSSEKVTP